MLKPTILVTNDDGIHAKGLAFLASIMKEFGDVWVVAPEKPQSGMSHAITISETLHLKKYNNLFVKDQTFSCSGTPVDCVKMGIHEIMLKKPDLVVSGINHGSNASISIVYSGTMSAAMEGAIEGIPSIGFSLLDLSADANFEPSKEFIKQIVADALKNSIPKDVVLNVNIPKTDQIQGIKICRQAKGMWQEKFEKRVNPFDKEYYWLTGEFVNHEPNATDTDIAALNANFISIVPSQFDLTAYEAMEEFKKRF